MFLWDRDVVYLDPPWVRHPLGGECLKFFDGVVGGVRKEVADKLKAFMVGYMSGGMLAERLAIEILCLSTTIAASDESHTYMGEVCLNDCGRDSSTNSDSIENHSAFLKAQWKIAIGEDIL